QFTTVALAWQMYQLTNSAFQVGLLGLSRAVPQIALAVFGGMLADALDRRRLLMAVQIVNFAVSASLAVSLLLAQFRPRSWITDRSEPAFRVVGAAAIAGLVAIGLHLFVL